ncbi:MAG: pyridoxamine 5'-phosphate oxidase family protein [Candidatus Latescibacteria bacterium]|nr:pyridoxamine 5'-phosphate oxidase family protein [Candidatus Latescibacterota bacterium]
MTHDQSPHQIPGAYHAGSRQLQDRFDCRRIADRLEQVTAHTTFTDLDRAFIDSCPMFFLATANQEGWPDCSYKGGLPGFVRVLDESTLTFPDYDGNGMFRSLGNISINPHVGLLFLDFEQPTRLRVNGIATLHADDPLLSEFPGAQLIVRVRAERIFPNCPRYIHKMRLIEYSVYAPTHDQTPPAPDWKQMEEFRDALPQRGGSLT